MAWVGSNHVIATTLVFNVIAKPRIHLLSQPLFSQSYIPQHLYTIALYHKRIEENMSHHAHFAEQQRTPPVEKEGERIDFDNGNKKNAPIPFSRYVFLGPSLEARFQTDIRPTTPVPAHVCFLCGICTSDRSNYRTNLPLLVWAPWERGWLSTWLDRCKTPTK